MIDPNDWEIELVSAGDDGRTCPACLAVHGQRQPIGQPFIGQGINGQPPFHEGCRCIARTVLKGFRAGQSPTPVRDAILKSLRG